MKGYYEHHEVFAKLVYNALKAYQLEVWLRTMTALEYMGRGQDLLIQLETSFQAFL
jgi:hypothetical protein